MLVFSAMESPRTAVLAVALLGAGGWSPAAESVVRFEPAPPAEDGRARFVARGARHSLLLDRHGPALLVRGPRPAVVHMRLVGARTREPVALLPLASTSNHLIGRDPRRWRTGVPHYGRVEYRQVYAGIDLAVHGDGQRLEYDFLVAPGADPRRVRLRFDGARRVHIEDDGRLVVQTAAGDVVQRPPVAYQDGPRGREPVASAYRRIGAREIAFAVGAYDRRRTLVIDPVLEYSTYLGGAGSDGVTGIAVDAAGNRYLTGFTQSADFPTADPLQPTLAGGTDVFVAKLNPQGSALLYSTFLGGSGADQAAPSRSTRAGASASPASTDSSDFPVVGAVQGARKAELDAFVARLDPSGAALVYSTYLGGSQHDVAESSHSTRSGWRGSSPAGPNPPTFPWPGRSRAPSAAASPTPSWPCSRRAAPRSQYATFLGGEHTDRAYAVAVDVEGAAYVRARRPRSSSRRCTPSSPPAAVSTTRSSPRSTATGAASSTRRSWWLGRRAGRARGRGRDGSRLRAPASTVSADFPTLPGLPARQGRPSRQPRRLRHETLALRRRALVYSTYLGGSRNETVTGLAVDSRGSVYVAGETSSMDFPASHAIMAPTGASDAFITKLDADGRRVVFSTCFGGAYDASDAPRPWRWRPRGRQPGRANGSARPSGVTPAERIRGTGGRVPGLPGSRPRTWALSVDPDPRPRPTATACSRWARRSSSLPPGATTGRSPLRRWDRVQLSRPRRLVRHLHRRSTAPPHYEPILPGQAPACAATGDCYRLGLAIIGLRRRFHWDASFRELLNDTNDLREVDDPRRGDLRRRPARDSPYTPAIETLVHRGVTGGCVAHGEIYCPEAPSRAPRWRCWWRASRDRPGFAPRPAMRRPCSQDVPRLQPLLSLGREPRAPGRAGGLWRRDVLPGMPPYRGSSCRSSS